MDHQIVIVLDFGGQYNQLIARRVRECGVYCEVKPYTTPVAELKAMAPIGIIFTGGPGSVYDPNSPQADPEIFRMGIPILGICYGCQLWPTIWVGGSPPRRPIPPGNMERRRPSSIRVASSSAACLTRVSPG